MKYLKFKRNFIGVLSEFKQGDFIEDIVALKENEIIAIEIKLSKNDFINDFKNKSLKHKNKDKNFYNKFYFCVPYYMADFAKNYLKNLPYGLFVVNDFKAVVAIKKAKLLKEARFVDKKILFNFLSRSTNENITLMQKNIRINNYTN
ncbi:hypothetical protein [Campylobacter sp.]|uniref:hypothetical protein n=1 Tax=Campylobacter sp. TaxID=205 RepID=UPI0025B92AFD|nr:hypothetical protein [Campylobacter sp.]